MPWHALICRPQRELEVARSVATRPGFRVFHLQTWVVLRHARKRAIVTRPLFPRYVFAHAAAERIFEVKWGDVVDVVRDRNRALAIPDPVMASLMARADPDGLVHSGPLHSDVASEGYTVGEFRRLRRNGPLHDLVVQIAAFDSDRQVRVWIELLGSRRQATVTAGELGEVVDPAIRG